MKPIILNINEMSDSREVYDSKPNLFFVLFIYLILTMLVIAFVWAYLGRIDVVVKSEAVLRPNEQVSTVVNEYEGTIERVNFEDGESVHKGDVLYTINHGDLKSEKEYQEQQLSDAKDTIQLLEKYKRSIEDNTNYFEKKGEQEEYYIQFETYFLNYETMKSDYKYSTKELGLNINSVSEQLGKENQELRYSKLLKSSVEHEKNQLSKSGDQKEYYNLYEKYCSDYDALNKQYSVKKREIELSTTKEGLVNSLDYYNSQMNGYTTLKKSVEQGQSYFTETNSYSLQYEAFQSKKLELNHAYEKTKEEYDLNVELKDYGVTAQEIKNAKTAMDDAYAAINNYKTSYLSDINGKLTDLKKNIQDVNLQKDNTLSKAALLKQNETDRKDALYNFKLQYIVDLEGKISALSDSISGTQDNLDAYALQKDKNYIYKSKDGEESALGSLAEFKNKELQATITNLDTYREKVKELEVTLEKLNKAIDSAVVTAAVDGVVNSNVDLVQGDVLAAGTQVLTVIPEGSNLYKANIYVSNADIGKIKKGMKIKCNVYALPNSEYGYMKGTISKISKDIKVDQENTAGYYLVEANLERKSMYDQNGKKANIKVGMSCQAQIITENKRILTYLLDKLDLWK